MDSTALPTVDDDAHDDEATLYGLLNVRRDATEEEIRRAYRHLASTLHPDKTPDPSLLSAAAREFSRVQEAYEVLSDPARRDIYDIYGIEGLQAGLELSGPHKSRDEMRKEWEAFRERQRRNMEETTFEHRGTYVFRTDATALISPYAPNLPRTPQLTNVFMTSGVDIPVTSSKHWGALGSEQDVLHIGGLVSVRDNVGGGSFMAGYRRIYSNSTTLGFEASAGLRSLLSAQAGFQLSQHASASIAASWNPKSGAGLQFVTTRQLNETTSGEFAWTMRPPEAAGMSLSVTHRREKIACVGRVEVGAATALALRVMKQLTETLTGRIALKLGTSGIEADVGGIQRVSEGETIGLSVVAGVQGVLLRVRYTRSGHVFEFPILLAPTFDIAVLLGAYILTPLAVFVAKDVIAGRLGQFVEARRILEERKRQAAEISQALAHAEAAAAVMAPVSRRKAMREASMGGLLIVLALYGEEKIVKDIALDRLQAAANFEGGEDKAVAVRVEAPVPVEHVSSATGAVHDAAANELPPAVADVTTAVQYLADGGKVIFHQGYSKASLMGFCNPAPTASKLLLVYFTFQGRPYRALVSDTEGAHLPGRGNLAEGSEAKLVERAAQRYIAQE